MPPLPHFVQIGETPVLLGNGADTLECNCGAVLARGCPPGALLGISIQCFRCGAVTATSGVPVGAVLPPRLRVVPPAATAVPKPIALPDGMALAGEAEVARIDALTRPANPPREPLSVTQDGVAAALTAYGDLTGQLDQHRAMVLGRFDPAAWLPQQPLAWALIRLQERVTQPNWSPFAGHADSVATAYLGAFRHFLACWSEHPLFPAIAEGAAVGGFSLHALAVFAAAKCLADSGNRVAFAPPSAGRRIDRFTLGPAGAEGLGVVVPRIGQFEWPRARPADAGAIRAAVQDAVTAVQGSVNLRQPGVVVLSAGTAPANFDQPVVDAINAVLRSQGRRHRGVTAVAAILPKLTALACPDQVGFGWNFYPIANPHAAPGTAARIGRRDDFAPFNRAPPSV